MGTIRRMLPLYTVEADPDRRVDRRIGCHGQRREPGHFFARTDNCRQPVPPAGIRA